MDGDDVDEHFCEELLSILLNGDIQTFWSRVIDGSSISKYISEASTFIHHVICACNEICGVSWSS